MSRGRLFPVIGVFALASLAAGPSSEAAEGCEAIARVVSLQGKVSVIVAPGDAWQEAKLDTVVCADGEIQVGDRSRAEVALTNQPKMRIDQNTRLRLHLTAPKATEVNVLGGAAYFFSRLPHRLSIQTPFVNAGIDGTEFLVRVTPDESQITVFEGKVRAENSLGEVRLRDGETARGVAGLPPQPVVTVRPEDAVQWALFYPPVLLPAVSASENSELRRAVEFAAAGAFPNAFDAFAAVPVAERNDTFYVQRTATLLAVGRLDEAKLDIARALEIAPENGIVHALDAVISVAQNENERALAQGQRAIDLSPHVAATWIARSYAEQALFRLEAATASAEQAVAAEPNNPLALARLAELWLMRGYRERAINFAERARREGPDLARPLTVLGFAQLVAIQTDRAKEAFDEAILLNSADPQPRFGQGLARIRAGALEHGRDDIEIAVALDPNNSLLRSYLGKAYFEEKRDETAARQYAMAKQLDPKDPTPWLYDAIRKQTENRPVEALNDLETSIALNDNRAVYRSRELLDQDRAGRGASLARIYTDLGFEQAGINEATQSLSLDPANSAAHRFLSDVYATQPRREIARASELLQSQLLQDININPVQPSIAETDLNIVTNGGPASAGLNEYTPLFARNQAQLNAQGVVGNDWTRAGEVVASGIVNRYSLSAGYTNAQSDGFRSNFDTHQEVYNAFAQAAITPEVNVQGEVRRRHSDQGDIRLLFDPDRRNDNLRRDADQDTARIGLRLSPSPQSNVLFSVIYTDRQERLQDPFEVPGFELPPIEFRNDAKGVQGESQYLYSNNFMDLAAGLSAYKFDTRDETLVDNQHVQRNDDNITQNTPYAYFRFNAPQPVTWTVGLAYDDYREGGIERHDVSPKAGVSWQVLDTLRIRGAAFQTVKPALVASQTLQPTQVAGFNQFFDDVNGTKARTLAAAIDARPIDSVYVGAEVFTRKLDTPFTSGTTETSIDIDDNAYRGYAYWAINSEFALTTSIIYDQFSANEYPFPKKVDTFSTPISLRYFSPTGLFASAGVGYVHQEVRLYADDGQILPREDGDFVTLDAGAGYRLPRRMGLISFEARNLLNERFNYQDDTFRQIGSGVPRASPLIPERTFIGRLILNFNT